MIDEVVADMPYHSNLVLVDLPYTEHAAPPRLTRARRGADQAGEQHCGHHRDPRAGRRLAGEAVRQLVPILRARGFEFDALCERRLHSSIRSSRPTAAASTRIRPATHYTTPRSGRVESSLEARRAGT